ncbi:MAG: hypothetical protein MI749_11835, partial [Desulfovibrionales bacterium]|nr:hypothetical protein [Desulfovibrionales bacterium]
PNKVGISYTEATFDTEKIKDYLDSFKDADMDLPTLMIVDGLNFDEDLTGILDEMKSIHETSGMAIWFAVKNHREGSPCEDSFPAQLNGKEDLFKRALFLKPVENKIEAVVLNDDTCQTYLLNPATMMLMDFPE